MAEGEGDKGNTDAEQLAAAAAAEAERLIQLDMAKQIADSPEGQDALVEAHALAQAEARADSDKAFAAAKARAKAQAEQAVIDGTAQAKIANIAQELAKRKREEGAPDAYAPSLFHPDGANIGSAPASSSIGAPMPGGGAFWPPVPALPAAGLVQLQQQHVAGGAASQNMNTGGLDLLAYQEQVRQKAAAQLMNPANAYFLSAATGILQPDGVTIKGDANIHGSDNDVLDDEVLIQANHFKVPDLWRQWLQKYKLVSVSQIAAASTVEGLKDLFLSAQTSESLIICLSDRANIKLFQGTCENMAKLLNAPANSEHHEMFLKV